MKLRNLMEKGIKYVTDCDYRFLVNAGLGKYHKMSDEEYLKKKYKAIVGKELNLKVPQTFNEKLQWLKLYDRNPEYTVMVDKYKVRAYIAEKLGGEYLIPLLGIWDSPDDIDFESLPEQFVLKCNHNSGLGMCICRDKSKLDIKKVKNGLKKGLEQDYYILHREWPYRNVARKIIAEQYMIDESGTELKDYKIHCFNGVPRFILVCSERFSEKGLHEDFYDLSWNIMNIHRPKHPNSSTGIQKPKQLKDMLDLAEHLAKDIPFVRIDFYVINDKIYFGEITFFPASGFESFEPEYIDRKLGDMIVLPK